MSRSLFVAVLLAGTAFGADEAYPKPNLLIEPAALAKPEAGKAVVVLDARDRKKYEAGHVPAARWVDAAAWAKAFGDGTDAVDWGQRIGALGITADTPVVVYDDAMTKDAARVWWMLKYWGAAEVRLLNGGWIGWQAGKFQTETDEPALRAVSFKAVAAPTRLATKAEVLKSLDGSKWQIVDARSEKEFCGTDALSNKKAGAIPGAKHLEWIDLIEKDTHRFKPAKELAKVFADAGVKLDAPTATHCQSGGRAAVMAFGMELMGATDVRNYYRSWGEWGNAADTPVVKPEPRKK